MAAISLRSVTLFAVRYSRVRFFMLLIALGHVVKRFSLKSISVRQSHLEISDVRRLNLLRLKLRLLSEARLATDLPPACDSQSQPETQIH